MVRPFRWLLHWLQRRCPHRGDWIVADILEGAHDHYQVRWCRMCGAVGLATHDPLMPRPELRRPEPTWQK